MMSRVRIIAVAVLILLALAGAFGQKPGAGQKQKEPPPDYFPLRVGDWWKYQSTTADGKQSEFTMTVLADEKQADGVVFHKVEIKSTIPIHEWYSKPSGWVLWHREFYTSNESMKVAFEPVRQYLKNPLTTGATWSWKGKGMMGVDIDESNQVIGSEAVEVPAGKFQAMKVESKVNQGGTAVTKTYWYANWVGLVKSMTDTGAVKSTSVLMDYSFKKKP
ncbi:MAG TPA: hypothetical protein VF708_17385 [Pyrinomonadaceae bacterium]|jgi:hypothetical protein